MTDDELRQELARLRQAGLNPLLCDTPVPHIDVPVLAGSPSETGDPSVDDYVMLPRELVGRHPVFLIDAEGLSMRDAGLMPGDRLEVEVGATVGDGDMVVAEVDGAFTVKTLFTDEEGLRWLVPHNADYDPIALQGHLWRIIGKVTGLRKGVPRSNYGDCAKAVMRLRRKMVEDDTAPKKAATEQPRNLVFKQFHKQRPIDFAAIREAVERTVVRQMRHRYEWYAAYRVLMDKEVLDDVLLSHFARQMQAWFPEAPIGCTSDALGVYAMGHTAKAWTLWSSDAFRRERQRDQSVNGFNMLYHRCEELRAALFPLPTIEPGLPF